MLLISAQMPVHQPKSRLALQSSSSARLLAKVEEALVCLCTARIAPNEDGQVYFEGTYWRARFYDPNCQVTVAVGDKAQVVVRDRLPLLVMPV